MTHLKKTDRQEIEILIDKGYSYRKIGKVCKKSHTAISREVKNNAVNGQYDADKAHHKAYLRRYYCKKESKKILKHKPLRKYIHQHLKEDLWSPEQIVGRWNKEHRSPRVSVPTVYNYLYSDYGIGLCKYLCTKRWKRKKRKKTAKRSIIPERVWIDDRPKEVESRRKMGHWEGDYIVSQKYDTTCFLTLLERHSRYIIVCKLRHRRSQITRKMINQVLGNKLAHTLTLDNDIGFSQHKKMNPDTYFCHPYSSWEKGAVEYGNRLVRRFFPKKSLLKKASYKSLKNAANKLNNMPRKCLNFSTPAEIFFANPKNAP